MTASGFRIWYSIFFIVAWLAWGVAVAVYCTLGSGAGFDSCFRLKTNETQFRISKTEEVLLLITPFAWILSWGVLIVMRLVHSE